MTLQELELVCFRNCRMRRLVFDAPQVLFTGRNGSGKSNLLEAIFYLSILRSFRSSSPRDLVMVHERAFALRGCISRPGYTGSVEVEQQLHGRRRLFIDGEPVRRASEFIREFRAVVFAPEDKEITAGSSACRRKFFDMFISVMEPEYFLSLQRYSAALSQRNAALRQGASEAAMAAFEPELAFTGAKLGTLRRRYAALIGEAVNSLPGVKVNFAIRYAPDYPEEFEDYLAMLHDSRERDRRRQYTTQGPQTDEFELSWGDLLLRNYGSNGQLRLAALYLKMAEFMLVNAAVPGGGTLALVDDVTGELDAENRAAFFALLRNAGQSFYTFTSRPPDEFFAAAQELRVEN